MRWAWDGLSAAITGLIPKVKSELRPEWNKSCAHRRRPCTVSCKPNYDSRSWAMGAMDDLMLIQYVNVIYLIRRLFQHDGRTSFVTSDHHVSLKIILQCITILSEPSLVALKCLEPQAARDLNLHDTPDKSRHRQETESWWMTRKNTSCQPRRIHRNSNCRRCREDLNKGIMTSSRGLSSSVLPMSVSR